jgi:uncharacterized membrane protein
MKTIINILAAFFTGLMAGLFFAWSFSVTLGLAKLSNREYLSAFQSMNREIQNPVFFLVFFGAPLSLFIASFLNSRQGIPFRLILAATILYLFGALGVTIVGNIPLNQTLEALDINSMSAGEMVAFRNGFESKWNSLNMIRTVTTLVSFILILISLLKRQQTLGK